MPACQNEEIGSIWSHHYGGVSPYNYVWSNGEIGDTLSGLLSGEYQLTITDARGCRDSLSVLVPSSPSLADWDIVLSDTVICEGSQFEISVDLPLVSDFYWTNTAGWVFDSSSVSLSESGVYYLNVITLEGCLLQDSMVLTSMEGDFLADFLLPAEGVINEPVVAIDISWPVPQSIEWVYDTLVTNWIASLESQEIVSYPEVGVYTIGLYANLGECVAYLEKEIQIYDSRDSLEYQIPGAEYNLISSFEIFPNPNQGDFSIRLILSSPQNADIWLFSEQGELVEYNPKEGQEYYELFYQNSPLPSGVYTAIARVGEEWIYLNFVVL